MQVIRPAGLNERRCITRDVLGLYGCIVTVATYKTSSPTPENAPLNGIIRVLKHCISKHPVLSTVIRDAETEKPQLVRASTMDLHEHMRINYGANVELHDATHIQRLLEEAHNEPFTGGDIRPQWRVYINASSSSLVHFDLAFAISHALTDGISGSIFHSTFLQALCEVKNLDFDANSIWDVPLGSQLLPPLDRAATFPISWSFLLPLAIKEFLPAWLSSAMGFGDSLTEDTWRGASARPERDMSTDLLPTAVRTAFISPKILQQILQLCRTYNARLTGLLNHLTARALAQALQARGHNSTKFIAQTPTDLRKCIPSARNQMANYSSVVIETIETSCIPTDSRQRLLPEDLKSIKCTTDLLAERSNTLSDQPVALLRYVSNIREWMLENAKRPASESFGMSNQGVFESFLEADTLGERSWIVEKVVFSQSADGLGAPFNVNVASVRDGPLALVITWWPGMLGVAGEEMFIEEVLEHVGHHLEIIASQQSA